MLENYRYSVGSFEIDFYTLELVGSDSFDFINKQSTFNFKTLPDNNFHLLSFLDSQGRIEFYCWGVKSNNTVTLLIPEMLKAKSISRLEKFLISEDVVINDLGLKRWYFIIGPKAMQFQNNDYFFGNIFEENALLSQNEFDKNLARISYDEIEFWKDLNGWPDFKGSDFTAEIINNLRLYDLSVSQNKGCYPGQETVSKIATRRGAAYSPALLVTSKFQKQGPIFSFDKKIGDIEKCREWNGKFYSSAKLLRDFRVEGLNLQFEANGQATSAVVVYYPLFSGSNELKANDLFYEATEAFKRDELLVAEKLFKQAIELNPVFADAYESLGVMLGRMERFSEAIEVMDQLTKVDPSSVLAHTNKSLFLMKLGKIPEAENEKSLATIKSFQKFGDEAKIKEKIDEEKKHLELEWAKREKMYQQVIEIDADDTLANYGLGSIAVERKNWAFAISYLERVVKVDPQYSVAYLSLGKAYKGCGLIELAASTWKEGISIAAKKGDLMPANQMQSELQQL